MTPRTPRILLLPILLAASTCGAAAKRPIGKTPPNVVVADRDGVKRRLPILKSYPESLFDNNPRDYINRLVFVPDGAGRLKRMVVRSAYPGPTISSESGKYTERLADVMLTTLFEAAPHRFPRGSELQWVEVKGSLLSISLNRAFAQEKFWRSTLQTRAALYAIVNTALEHDSAGVERVQILIEGKPVAKLGNISTSKPLTPDMSLVSGP